MFGSEVEDVHRENYQCDVCRKDCRSKWHLGVHVKTVHEGRFDTVMYARKNAQINRTLKFMWEMFRGKNWTM